jgi:enamine deaminase RidA (YjgF/YER057c/UK114 family)
MGDEQSSRIERKLAELGLSLPPKLKVAGGVELPFQLVRVLGPRVLISGHGPLHADGTLSGPIGKVGKDVSLEEACAAARGAALAILGSLKETIGSLDDVVWVRAFGMVNSAPGFSDQSAVINGFSDLILELYGADAGAHARSAVGVAELPFGLAVEIEAEIQMVRRPL